MNETQLTLRMSMPQWSGKIMDPRYVPPQHQAGYEKQWGEWLRAHDKRDWPVFMREYVAWKKHTCQAP